MSQFLISAAATAALTSVVRALGGKPIHRNSWIVYWDGSADSLCRRLRPACDGGVVVCALTSDWSYR
jgi:hypothetical protein